jgi:ubiquinol-cytochrome c reductase subunit 6
MGFWDSFTDLVEAATPWSTVEAEAVTRGGAGSDKTPADKDDGGEGETEVCSTFYCSKANLPLRFRWLRGLSTSGSGFVARQ